jgi:hypothetical protein
VTPSTSPSTSPATSPTPTVKPTSKPPVWHVKPGARLTFTDEGVYQVFFRHPGSAFPPRFSILKFTIDHTPPALSLIPLNAHQGAAGPVLDRPGRLRLGAVDTLSGVERIEYQLDGSPRTAYSDDVSFGRTLLVPTAGDHSITIRATDAAGNVAELADQHFQVVDTTPTPTPSPSDTPTPSDSPTPTPAARATATPTPAPTAQAPQGQTIVSFGAPSTFRCANATPGQGVHLTWTTTSTTGVTISIDGPGKYADYPPNGSADLPFACTETQHTYLLTTQGSGPAATRTAVVKRV